MRSQRGEQDGILRRDPRQGIRMELLESGQKLLVSRRDLECSYGVCFRPELSVLTWIGYVPYPDTSVILSCRVPPVSDTANMILSPGLVSETSSEDLSQLRQLLVLID